MFLFGRTLGVFMALVPLAVSQFIVEVLEPPRSGVRRTVQKCDATGANFGADIVSFSFGKEAIGCAATTQPANACQPVTMVDRNSTGDCLVNFAIVPRGQCGFSEKAYYVQNAGRGGFRALIVYNQKGEPPIDMAGGKFADKIIIPVLMVSYNCMLGIRDHYPPSEGYVVQITISPGYYDLFRYLIPFLVVVGFCFTVLVISLLVRLCRERRRIARKRLSKKHLKKIPTRRFKIGEEPETCAICLDDFIEDEKLRVLPCKHVYHCKCIDPWLTRNRKVCPMCKRRVGEKNPDSEDSDEERGPPPLVDPSRYRQLQDEDVSGGSMVVAYSPSEQASSSQIHAEIHNDQPINSSRERLVTEEREIVDPLSDIEGGNENVASSGSSLKERFRNFMNRVSRSHNNMPQLESEALTQGLDNIAFEEHAVNSASEQPITHAEDETSNEISIDDPATSAQFRDPFEDKSEPNGN